MNRTGERAPEPGDERSDRGWGPTPPPPEPRTCSHESFAARWRHGAQPAATVGFEGYFRWMNDAQSRWWGWSRPTLQAVDWWEFLHPDDQDDMVAAIEAIMNRSRFVDVPFRALAADGRYRWLLLDLQADPDTEEIFGMVREPPSSTVSAPVAVGEWELCPSTSELVVTGAAAEVVGLPGGTPLPLDDLLARLAGPDRPRLRRALEIDGTCGTSMAETVHLGGDGSDAGGPIRLAAGRPITAGDGTAPRWRGIIRQAGG
jgi:PAS domain S-box-containing protein